MSNLGTEDVLLLLDTKNRDSGSISNSRFNIQKIANVKSIEVLDVHLFNTEYTIRNSNRTIFWNDGVDRQANISKAQYDGTTLASAVQTALNSVGSGYTVSYNEDTLKITISNASAFVLKTGTTTNSIWTTLGFNTGTDSSSATSHTGDNVIKLTSKYYYITSNIVDSTHINDDLPDNILLVLGNNQNFGNLLTRDSPQIIPSADTTIDRIALKLYNDSDEFVETNGIDYSILLRFKRG